MIVADSILALYSRIFASLTTYILGSELATPFSGPRGTSRSCGPEATSRGLDRAQGAKNTETAESGAAFLFEEMML